MATCPDAYLLWFHHVKWTYKMPSGNTLWDELINRYYNGAEAVKKMQATWLKMAPYIDQQRHESVRQLLAMQHEEAVAWRNACVLYFQTFSRQPIPAAYEKPAKSSIILKAVNF